MKDWLQDNGSWLLIFDNVDVLEEVNLNHFLPANPRGDILLTSRAQDFRGLGIPRPFELDRMQPEEALEFLFKSTGRYGNSLGENEAAQKIAEALGYLPLALDQAAAYIVQKKARFQDYYKSWQRRRMRLLETIPRREESFKSVATTWDISFKHVEKASKAAADLLRVSAFWSSDKIPLELITEGGTRLGSRLAAAVAGAVDDPLIINELLEPLLKFSLIRLDQQAQSYDIHPLVQDVIKDSMKRNICRLWAERAARAVHQIFTHSRKRTSRERLLSHARVAIELIRQYGFAFEDVADLPHALGSFLQDRCEYWEAESLYKLSLSIREKTLGNEHLRVALSFHDLASLYLEQDRDSEVELFLNRSLEIKKKNLGEEAPELVESLNGLVVLYMKQKKYEEAQAQLSRAYAIAQKTGEKR